MSVISKRITGKSSLKWNFIIIIIIRLYCPSRITKYIDAEIVCFGSLLELHEYKHFLYQSFINIYVISSWQNWYFVSTEEKHGTVSFKIRYIVLNLQVRLRGKVDKGFAFQPVEHYMKTMVRVPLVPGKLYITFFSPKWKLPFWHMEERNGISNIYSKF